VLKNCAHKTDKLSLWLQALVAQCGFNKAAVALANKNARILWAMASNGKAYEALAAQAMKSAGLSTLCPLTTSKREGLSVSWAKRG
jgi:hypothetical protein